MEPDTHAIIVVYTRLVVYSRRMFIYIHFALDL
jgi:hypothetical protein